MDSAFRSRHQFDLTKYALAYIARSCERVRAEWIGNVMRFRRLACGRLGVPLSTPVMRHRCTDRQRLAFAGEPFTLSKVCSAAFSMTNALGFVCRIRLQAGGSRTVRLLSEGLHEGLDMRLKYRPGGFERHIDYLRAVAGSRFRIRQCLTIAAWRAREGSPASRGATTAVRAALLAIATLMPERFEGVRPTLEARHEPHSGWRPGAVLASGRG